MALLKVFSFFFKKIDLLIMEILGTQGKYIAAYIIMLALLFILKEYIFPIDYYNSYCSNIIIGHKSFFCFDFITLPFYLFIPELSILGIIFIRMFREYVGFFNNSTKAPSYLSFRYIVLFYIIFRGISVLYPNVFHGYLYNNFYIIGYYGFIVLCISFLLSIVLKKEDFMFNMGDSVVTPPENNKQKETEVVKKNEIDRDLVLDDIKEKIPKVLNEIFYSSYDKILYDKEGNKIDNIYTIKEIVRKNENEVLISLNLGSLLLANISLLSKEDWTLKIHANGNILQYVSARWISEQGVNGIILKHNKITLDFAETYKYPYLFEKSPLLKNPLDICLGIDEDYRNVVVDLYELPHLLTGGTTRGGKSVGLTDMAVSFMKSIIAGNDLRVFIIDPKMVEFKSYSTLPYFNVCTNPDKALNVLKWLVAEMLRRYDLMKNMEGNVKNIKDYNERVGKNEKLPYIPVIIDELSDLMMSGNKKEVESALVRILQLGRAAGINVILATQNPCVQVITGLIKANTPSSLGFQAVEEYKSKIIIGSSVLKNIKFKGEAYMKVNSDLKHIKTFYIENNELDTFIEYYKKSITTKTDTPLYSNVDSGAVSEDVLNFLNEIENDSGASMYLDALEVLQGGLLDSDTITFSLLKSLLEKNGYENKEKLMNDVKSLSITTREIKTIVNSLKTKGYVYYDDVNRRNFIFNPEEDYSSLNLEEYLSGFFETIFITLKR